MQQERLRWALGCLERAYPEPEDPVRVAVTMALTAIQDIPDAEAVLGQLLRSEIPGGKDSATWAPAKTYILSGDFPARVRPEALDPEQRWRYATRIGDVVAVRNGQVLINFRDQTEGLPSSGRFAVADVEVDIASLLENR